MLGKCITGVHSAVNKNHKELNGVSGFCDACGVFQPLEYEICSDFLCRL